MDSSEDFGSSSEETEKSQETEEGNDDFDESESGSTEASEEESDEDLEIEASKLSEADPLKYLTLDKDLKTIAKDAYEEYKVLKRKTSKKLQYGSVVIYPIQYVAAETFMKTTGITQLKAKMGFGKTLTGIHAAMQSKRCLIIVSSSSLTTWKEEIDKGRYNLYDPKPEETKVFIYDPSVKTHREYLDDATEKTFGKNDQVIIICKDASVDGKTSALNIFKKIGLKGNEFTVIVDEGHLKKTQVLASIQPLLSAKGDFKVTRELLMSASDIDTRKIGFDAAAKKFGKKGYTIDHQILSNITNPVPKPIWHFEMMESNAYHDNQKEWETAVKNIAKKHNHVVLFSEEAVFNSLDVADAFGKKKPFKATTAKSTMANFAKAKDAVVHLTTRKITGKNIDAGDSVIIFPTTYREKAVGAKKRGRPKKNAAAEEEAGDDETELASSTMSTDTFLQAVGRVLRPGNKRKTVDVYVMMGTKTEYLKTLYAKAFQFDQWEDPHDSDVNVGMVSKGTSFIKALGQAPNKISVVDLCIFLANYVELEAVGVDNKFIIGWWNKHKGSDGIESILNEDLIADIVDIK